MGAATPGSIGDSSRSLRPRRTFETLFYIIIVTVIIIVVCCYYYYYYHCHYSGITDVSGSPRSLARPRSALLKRSRLSGVISLSFNFLVRQRRLVFCFSGLSAGKPARDGCAQRCDTARMQPGNDNGAGKYGLAMKSWGDNVAAINGQ